jgi:hypothetical protein
MARDKRPSDRIASDEGHLLRALKATNARNKREKELAASILANRKPKKRESAISGTVRVPVLEMKKSR